MLYEMNGTIKLISDMQTFPSGFTKRQFVVTTEGDRYPQDIAMSFKKERCAVLDNFKAGERVKATFGLSGREWNGKYYVDIDAIKLESLDAAGGDAEGGAVVDVDEPPLGGDMDVMPF